MFPLFSLFALLSLVRAQFKNGNYHGDQVFAKLQLGTDGVPQQIIGDRETIKKALNDAFTKHHVPLSLFGDRIDNSDFRHSFVVPDSYLPPKNKSIITQSVSTNHFLNLGKDGKNQHAFISPVSPKKKILENEDEGIRSVTVYVIVVFIAFLLISLIVIQNLFFNTFYARSSRFRWLYKKTRGKGSEISLKEENAGTEFEYMMKD